MAWGAIPMDYRCNVLSEGDFSEFELILSTLLPIIGTRRHEKSKEEKDTSPTHGPKIRLKSGI
jgi:hypothetical protein